jgi:hypothetical protein
MQSTRPVIVAPPRAALGLVLVGLLAVSGCGGTGTVSGVVRFNGELVRAGRVTIITVKGENKFGESKSTAILDDGSYTIVGVPSGDVRITVETFLRRSAGKTSMPKDMGKGMAPENPEGFTAPPEKYVKLPERYGSVESTDLIFKVTAGSQTINLDMKP